MDAVLGAARLLQYGCALTLFGVALFQLYGHAPGAAPDHALARFPHRGLITAAVLGALSSLAWLSVTAASFTGDWTALLDVTTGTRIGSVLVLRALLFASLPVLCLMTGGRLRWMLLAAGSGLATASFAWTGHGAAGTGMAGLVHQGSDVLHLLAAGAWAGALVVLCAGVLRGLRTPRAGAAHELTLGLLRFSAAGPAIVALLVLTGIINSGFLIGPAHLGDLFDTRYGVVLLVKLGLFAGMLGLAALNRLRLTPRLRLALAGNDTRSALVALRRSLLAETTLALLVLATVAWLGLLVPPMDS